MAAVLPPVLSPLNTLDILTMCGINTAAARTGIRDDMMTDPEGISHLTGEDVEGIQSACAGYARRTIANGRFNVTRVQQKQLISLMHWVKDKSRLNEPAEFAAHYTQAMLRSEIEEARERHQDRTDQKKKGESISTTDFQVKLETASQWERWDIELEGTLKMIIGANGVPLSYVIRPNDAPDLSPQATWGERAKLAAPHTGNKFKMDALAVHNIITRNISESSDAYTYIKPRIKETNGRVDIKALKSRYQNAAMQDMYINEAKKTLAIISYKSERAMKFEVFSGKFQNAVNILETYGRGMHNDDIVDLVWTKLQNADLSLFVSSLQVDYRRNRQPYTEILQEIATQIPATSTQPFSPTSVSDIHRIEGGRDGSTNDCPTSGAHHADGTLYTGSYPYKQWHSKEVIPHHVEIRAARDQAGGGRNRKGPEMKRKAAELRSQISELESTKRRLISEMASTPAAGPDDQKGKESRAGTAFGGRAEKAAGKG